MALDVPVVVVDEQVVGYYAIRRVGPSVSTLLWYVNTILGVIPNDIRHQLAIPAVPQYQAMGGVVGYNAIVNIGIP
jgi:hypothetical protein